MCLTLNQLLLRAYGSGESFEAWSEEDLPNDWKKQLQQSHDVVNDALKTQWIRDKNSNRVLKMGHGSSPLSTKKFVTFQIPSDYGLPIEFAITLNSWNNLVSQFVKMLAQGRRVIHVCLHLIGMWRSGNIKGTAFVSEVHAQRDTSVYPVYLGTICNPTLPPSLLPTPPINTEENLIREIEKERDSLLAKLGEEKMTALREQNRGELLRLMKVIRNVKEEAEKKIEKLQ